MKLGMMEIVVILAVALIVLGPDNLPKYAQKLGAALKEFRKFSSEATKDIRESIVEPLEEAQKPLKEAMEPITDLTDEIGRNVEDLKKSFTDLGKPDQKEKAETPVEDVDEGAANEEEVPAGEEPAAQAPDREASAGEAPSEPEIKPETGTEEPSETQVS